MTEPRITGAEAQSAAPAVQSAQHLLSNSPSVIDGFYKGAISNVDVERFWGIGPES